MLMKYAETGQVREVVIELEWYDEAAAEDSGNGFDYYADVAAAESPAEIPAAKELARELEKHPLKNDQQNYSLLIAVDGIKDCYPGEAWMLQDIKDWSLERLAEDIRNRIKAEFAKLSEYGWVKPSAEEIAAYKAEFAKLSEYGWVKPSAEEIAAYKAAN